MKMKFLFILSIIIFISIAINVHAEENKTILASSETTGQKCGSNCDWVIYNDGTMVVSGTGPMHEYVNDYNQRPWINYLQNIQSVEIQEGITTVGWNAFYNTAVTSATLADSVEYISAGGFQDTLQELIIGENSKLGKTQTDTAIGTYVGVMRVDHLVISCKGGIEKCQTKQNLFTDIGISTDFRFYEEKDSNGKITLKYEKGGYKTYDSHGNITGKYDLEGNILETYAYNPDGSILTYDTNGKLIGIQGKRILTVDEASALVKGNKNTFSIRYR